MAALKIADRWFDRKKITDDITFLWEPHVFHFLRCNIWFVRGRDKHMLVDTGMGMGSLKDEIQDLADKPVTAVATHIHFDHVGCLHEFDERLMHKVEAPRMEDYNEFTPLHVSDFPPEFSEGLADIGDGGEPMNLENDLLITAAHEEGFDPDTYKIKSTVATRTIEEGDIVDTGDRQFEVFHLPGHSPGSIGLWEAASGTFFSGDAIYDGPLVDQLPDSSIAQYIATMKRLRELPVSVVHGGHGASFGRDRLVELADEYLAVRDN